MKRFLSLFCVLALLAACFVSCDEGGEGGDTGDENYDGTLASLDFGGETLTVSVSVNDPEQVTFKNAGLYTKGPDKSSTETVQKKVLARNKKVAEDLNATVIFQTTNWGVAEVQAHLEQLVTNDAGDAPDVYNNDILPMSTAMLNGYFWNVTEPGLDAKGNAVKSYFDFDADCWYGEYMRGATLSSGRLYLLVGDYNIDILRFAWVLFVNIDRWNATFAGLSPEDGWGFTDYESACDFIAETGDWFYDDVIALSALAHNDSGGSTQGKTDKGDEQIGLCINSVAPRIFTWGSGVSVFMWTKNDKACAPGEGTPSMIPVADTDPLVRLGDKYTALYNGKGVLASGIAVKDSTTMFMDGKIVMSMAELGEMESAEMRGTSFKRGILPFPRYAREYTDGINTVVHDQAEVSAILNTADNFSLASAYMQYINEESVEILDVYYEEVLKFKYNESRGARAMIDMVHDSIDSPFDSVMSINLYNRAIGNNTHFYTSFQQDALLVRNSTFVSTYEKQRETLQVTLEKMIADFEKLS